MSRNCNVKYIHPYRYNPFLCRGTCLFPWDHEWVVFWSLLAVIMLDLLSVPFRHCTSWNLQQMHLLWQAWHKKVDKSLRRHKSVFFACGYSENQLSKWSSHGETRIKNSGRDQCLRSIHQCLPSVMLIVMQKGIIDHQKIQVMLKSGSHGFEMAYYFFICIPARNLRLTLLPYIRGILLAVSSWRWGILTPCHVTHT